MTAAEDPRRETSATLPVCWWCRERIWLNAGQYHRSAPISVTAWRGGETLDFHMECAAAMCATLTGTARVLWQQDRAEREQSKTPPDRP